MVEDMTRARIFISDRLDVALALACGPVMAGLAGLLARLLDPGSF